jgi:phosphonate transport system permease protein
MAVLGAELIDIEAHVERITASRSRAWAIQVAVWTLGAALLAWAAMGILVGDTDWSRITSAGLVQSIARFGHVDFALLPSLIRPAVETVLMASLATLLGVVLALPVAWLGASNVTPLGRASYLFARAMMTLSRSVHEIVWGLIFVAAAGLGTLAGILAMAVRSVGFVSKTVAEAIEDVDQGPVEALRAVGAGRLQILIFAIVPQVIPLFLSNVVFEWDVNIRRSTIMGLVGAGGLGLALYRQMAAYNYGGVSAVVVVVLVLIVIGEVVSHHARSAIL